MAEPVDLGDCRFYESKFPKAEELVMVVVKSIQDLAVYVELLEYNNAPGMILMSELSKRRIRSVNKLIKVGKHECVVVMKTDEEKGYIDLSKRRATSEDITKCEEKYSKAKAVQTIIRHIAEERKMSVLELNEKITWPLARKYGDEFEAFRRAAIDPEIFASVGMDEDIKETILTDVRRRFAPPKVKIRARVEVCCLGVEGIEAVRKALLAGRDLPFTQTEGGHEVTTDIRLIATPKYLVTAHSTSKELGLEHVEAVLNKIKESIMAVEDGSFVIEEEARILGVEEANSEDEEDSDEEESDSDSGSEVDEGMGRVESSDEEED